MESRLNLALRLNSIPFKSQLVGVVAKCQYRVPVPWRSGFGLISNGVRALYGWTMRLSIPAISIPKLLQNTD